MTDEQKAEIKRLYHHDMYTKFYTDNARRMHIVIRAVIPMRDVKLPFLEKKALYDKWHAEMMDEVRFETGTLF